MDSLEEKVEVELTVAEERAQFEKEKLSRRQALARIGFQAGAAAIAALTADELLRKVGKEMQRRTKDHKVAQQVAKELNNAGVAFAVPPTPTPTPGCGCPTSGSGTSWWRCVTCTAHYPEQYKSFNCYPTSPNCLQCCTDMYTACMQENEGVLGGIAYCDTRLDDCQDTTCGA